MTELLAVAGLTLTVLLAYMQIQRNQEATIRAQEAHLRNQLKVDLYEKAATVFHNCSLLVRSALNTAQVALSSLQLAVKGLPLATNYTASELDRCQFEAQASVSQVLLILEQYEIVFSRFISIRRQLAEEHSQLLNAYSKFWVEILPYIPLKDPVSKPKLAPTIAEVAALEPLLESYQRVCLDICAYLIDLQIETQNELLGDLFERRIPLRNPADPEVKVLSRDMAALDVREPGRLA